MESQPFGGEGLSGTGPKAGGPHYLQRFFRTRHPARANPPVPQGEATPLATVQKAIFDLHWHEPRKLEEREMPGPTGESNRLALWPRGAVLCLGPTVADATAQAGAARRVGCPALTVVPGASGPGCIDGFVDRSDLTRLQGIALVALWSEEQDLKAARRALAARTGRIIPLVASENLESYGLLERHTCIDTTAAGGNASLLTSVEDEPS